MAEDDRPDGILGRIAPAPDRRVPTSSVDVMLVRADVHFSAKVAGILRKHAHTVVEAESAAAALDAVREGCHPRLVVVDVDGVTRGDVTALAALQADAACADTAFLELTGTGARPPAALRVEQSLYKPVEAAELVMAVRRYCGG